MKKLIFSSKYFMFLFMLTSLVYVGCNKEEINKSQNVQSVVNRSISNILPQPVNGIIKFNNYDNYKNVYLELQALYESDKETFNSIYEADGNFVSVYNKLINDEFESWETAYKPFITDPILMVILNEHFEFQVGDALITYVNNEDIITSDPDNSVTRNQIRNINKGGPLELRDIPKGTTWGKDTDETSYKLKWCGCEIKIEQLCGKIRIFGKCNNFVGSGEATVSFTRPDKLESESHRTDGSFEFFIIPLNIPFTITASVAPDCLIGNTRTATLDYDPSKATCDRRERDSGWDWAQQGNHGMSLRVSFYRTFNTRWKSEIHSKSFKNGKWPITTANRLEVSIDASTRQELCQVFRIEDDNDSCNNCGKEDVGVNNGLNDSDSFRHCDGDIFGNFKKVIGNITLSKTVSIDFDCCL